MTVSGTNTNRPHFSPDMCNYGTPMIDAHNKRSNEETRTYNPN